MKEDAQLFVKMGDSSPRSSPSHYLTHIFEQDNSNTEQVSQKLKQLYDHNIRPVENAYNYETFRDPPISDADFNAKPLILGKH